MTVTEDMGESLLPLPGASQTPEEKRKWRVGWLLLTAAFLIQFHINMWYLHHHHTGPKPPPNPPPNPQWPAEAVQAAQLAASHWCSGNGNVFADTLAVNADGTPLCECADCFSGPDCSVAVPACIANADSGNPLLFEAFWRANPDLGTVVIPGWYRVGYLPRPGADTFFNDAFIDAVRGMHTLVGNAVTEGRHILVGTGSTQLVNAVVHSLALQNPETVSPVVARAPYYSAYKIQTDMFNSSLYTWAGEPEDALTASKGPGVPIELIASPNNPTFQIQELGDVHGHVAYDHAYYWPHLTSITEKYDHDIMLFTLSKVTGHAGSRIGWAIIKDPDLYEKMSSYLRFNTMGISHDSQFRATQILRSVINSYSKPQKSSDKQGIFHYGREVLQSRWARLQSIVKGSSRFTLQELKPEYCHFFKEQSGLSPGYAWLHCEREEDANCSDVMLKAGIIGRPGIEFGASSRYVRLALLDRQSSFDNFAARLSGLVAQP